MDNNKQDYKNIDKEQYLIGKLKSKYIGDDAAVIGDESTGYTLYSMDAFFEDIHFKRSWMNMQQIGRKAMLVNLSDAIAMNAEPQYALVSISMPKDMSLEEIDALTGSLECTAKEFGCEIIGGDTIAGDKLHLSITVISKSKSPLFRKGLEEGDYLAFTGTLGESKRDLEKLFNGEKIDHNSRFFEPTLRSDFISKVRGYICTGMDISDGLFCDTNKLLDINKYGFDSILDIDDTVGLSGEEYEMLISFKPDNYDKVLELAKQTNTPLSVFAKIADNQERYPCLSHHF